MYCSIIGPWWLITSSTNKGFNLPIMVIKNYCRRLNSKNAIQSSAVILDYHNGQVKALIGGGGIQPPGSYNRAVHFPRSTGSSIKPLTVYSAAIDTNQSTACLLYTSDAADE